MRKSEKDNIRHVELNVDSFCESCHQHSKTLDFFGKDIAPERFSLCIHCSIKLAEAVKTILKILESEEQ